MMSFPVTEGSSGIDIQASESVLIQPNTRKAVSSGIGVIFPKNCYGKITGRSGFALKNCIDIFPGTIDSDYRGKYFPKSLQNLRLILAL